MGSTGFVKHEKEATEQGCQSWCGRHLVRQNPQATASYHRLPSRCTTVGCLDVEAGVPGLVEACQIVNEPFSLLRSGTTHSEFWVM